MPEQEQPLKEATIKVLKIKDEKWNEKPYWKVIDDKADEYSLWNKDLRDHMKEGESYPIKYSTKHVEGKGDFRTIQGIVGVELKGKGGWGGGGNRFTFEQEMEKQRIIAAQCVFKTFKEKGDWTLTPDETMVWIMGKVPQNPATKAVEGKQQEVKPLTPRELKEALARTELIAKKGKVEGLKWLGDNFEVSSISALSDTQLDNLLYVDIPKMVKSAK